MGLFDFLKKNKGRRRSGGRSAQEEARRSDQGTKMMQLPPMPPGPGMGGPPGAMPSRPNLPLPPVPSPNSNATTVRPVTPPPMPPPPAAPTPMMAPPVAPPAHAQPSTASGEATQYISTQPASSSEILGVLVAIDGELKGQVFTVGDGENRIGRGRNCEIEMPSPKISRDHAMLIHQDGMFVIKPLNEKNPTFINEVPTQGDELGDGDALRMGLTTLKFRTI